MFVFTGFIVSRVAQGLSSITSTTKEDVENEQAVTVAVVNLFNASCQRKMGNQTN